MKRQRLHDVLPPSITLRKWNVKGLVLEELVGAFDIIHVRFFVFVLLREEVSAVIDKFVTMLSTCAKYSCVLILLSFLIL